MVWGTSELFFSVLSPLPTLFPHPIYLGQEFQSGLGGEGLGYRRAEHQSSQPLGARGAHLPAPATAGECEQSNQGHKGPRCPCPPVPLSSESLVFNKMTDWLRASASQVQKGWGPGTDSLSLAGKE